MQQTLRYITVSPDKILTQNSRKKKFQDKLSGFLKIYFAKGQ